MTHLRCATILPLGALPAASLRLKTSMRVEKNELDSGLLPDAHPANAKQAMQMIDQLLAEIFMTRSTDKTAGMAVMFTGDGRTRIDRYHQRSASQRLIGKSQGMRSINVTRRFSRLPSSVTLSTSGRDSP